MSVLVASSSVWPLRVRTGNLDPETAKGIMDLLADINDRGTTVLMATHDEKAVNRLNKRVVELVDGHVVRDEMRGHYRGSSDESVISGAVPDGEAAGERQTSDSAIGGSVRASDVAFEKFDETASGDDERVGDFDRAFEDSDSGEEDELA